MSQSAIYLLISLLMAILLDYYIVTKWALYKKRLEEQTDSQSDRVKLLKQVFLYEPIQLWKSFRITRFINSIDLLPYLEVVLLFFWAVYVGWEYLDLDPRKIPRGGELGSAIAANHLWTQIFNCGECAMWNGFQRGGYPAFADIQGSMLHPVVILTTLLFGVVNGVKVTLVISFWLAGLAQWWIARELSLSWLPRMWSAGIAVAGGHLASRMELGVYGVVLSTAATSLALAALIRLARHNTRRNAILLGIFMASAIVSGQGYMQVGLIGILPVYCLFYWGKGNLKSTWSNYGISAIIAFLLAAPFLVPFLHFSPNITKWFDPRFSSAQPISYFILNLVIDDPSYYYSAVMAKLPYPDLYALYIGWIPVLLFLYALCRISAGEKRLLGFMVAGIVAEFLIASAILLKLLVGIFPTLAGIRHSSQIAGLAIPLILGISAYGLEKLLALNWLGGSAWTTGWFLKLEVPLKWLSVIPLVYSLQSCMQFTTLWTGLIYLKDDLFLTLEQLETTGLQWVNPPFGEHVYVESAIAMGLKLSPGILTWDWKNRSSPPPYLTAERLRPKTKDSPLIESALMFTIKSHTENPYAFINSKGQIIPCQANGSGGYIEVHCDTDEKGVLTIQENMWTGWHAWRDGEEIEIIVGDRIQVNSPTGKHMFIFRYQPWDVPTGLFLFPIGVTLSIWLWFLPNYKGDLQRNIFMASTINKRNTVRDDPVFTEIPFEHGSMN